MTLQLHPPIGHAGGGAFFAKEPGDGTVVPYHQDSQYWGLHHTDTAATMPHTVVVWLAFTDVDEENAVRGTDRAQLTNTPRSTDKHTPLN
jgi:hypothetical protein